MGSQHRFPAGHRLWSTDGGIVKTVSSPFVGFIHGISFSYRHFPVKGFVWGRLVSPNRGWDADAFKWL